MWTVYLRLTLIHHNAIFVRTVNVFRSQHCLPASRNATGWSEDVVIPVPLVELWPFNGWMMFATIEHQSPFIQDLRAIHTHLVDMQNAFDPGATVGEGMDQVRVTVVVPKWTRIDP